jgi:DNA polymerase-3 subunit gamma/tau
MNIDGSFIVSARKYRPDTFDTVVGQQHVTDTLKNALKTGQLAQAFLFCGPRGVGKTTCARILAKVLNCQSPTDDMEPCDQCDNCAAFKANNSMNIHELDAASNNSVEHIRTLIDQVRFPPQHGKFKIYIIDEVHMLSTAAFNAFLKTLEEPPAYAKFILATTERHKIIPTILSRCQIFDFKRIQLNDIKKHLQKIADNEHITAADEALHIIAQKADGGLRDALSTFDRIASASGAKEIKYQDVLDNLNILDYEYFFKMTSAIVKEDSSEAFLMFSDILTNGFDGETFINGLAEHFRNLIVCQNQATHKLLEIGGTIRQQYIQQANEANLDLLTNALNIAGECELNIKFAKNRRLHIEMALIKMCHINKRKREQTELLMAAQEKKKLT